MAEAIVANALRYQGREHQVAALGGGIGLSQALMVDPAELEAKKEEWAKMKAERDAQEKIREERERRLTIVALAEQLYLANPTSGLDAITKAEEFYAEAKEFLDKQ